MNKDILILKAKNRVRELFGHRFNNLPYKTEKEYIFHCVECNSEIKIEWREDVHIDYNIEIDDYYMTWDQDKGYSHNEDYNIDFYCPRFKVLL